MESELALMPIWKRLFDFTGVLVIFLPLFPVMALSALAILIFDGRPIFYISERMKTPTKGFSLVKFRTMRPDVSDSGVSGGDKVGRITKTGNFLRRSRLDEMPQLWNILKGDMSFVGPRPPLRIYVEDYPEYYVPVLRSRPGVTGLATLIYHRHESRLLDACQTAAETDAVYRRVCIPRKAHLDLIYQERLNICLDVWLLLRTAYRKRKPAAAPTDQP